MSTDQAETHAAGPEASHTGLQQSSAGNVSSEQDSSADEQQQPRIEQLENMRLADLLPYAQNSRTHSPEQVAQIALSIMEFGFINPVLIDEHSTVIAGHGRLLAAEELQLDTIPCRRISHLTDAQKRAYIIADNQLALNAGWDDELLRSELADLQAEGFDLTLTGFDEADIGKMLGVSDVPENPYSSGVSVPPYDVRGDEPLVEQLLDTSKTDDLLQALNESGISGKLLSFLQAAAYRHVRFDYEQIAEYYAHAPANVQRLMEQSALVIIDFDQAIQDGFVRLSDKVTEIYQAENADDNAE